MSVFSESPPDSRSLILQIVVSRDGSSARVVVSGELDMSNVDRLRSELITQRVPGRLILLDLSGVGFMDSAGICAVLEADAAARADGHAFSITSLSHAARRVLEISGAQERLYDSNALPAPEANA